jgi:catechol 2,3-dioxygenase-like lactoylglutathione lyase family enzyme
VILYVSDLDASVRFYRDVAGLPHRYRPPPHDQLN